jgi:hypothetical protein
MTVPAVDVVMAGGLAYADDPSQWLTYEPADPAGDLAAAHHVRSPARTQLSACDGTPTAYGVGPRDHLRALTP